MCVPQNSLSILPSRLNKIQQNNKIKNKPYRTNIQVFVSGRNIGKRHNTNGQVSFNHVLNTKDNTPRERVIIDDGQVSDVVVELQGCSWECSWKEFSHLFISLLSNSE